MYKFNFSEIFSPFTVNTPIPVFAHPSSKPYSTPRIQMNSLKQVYYQFI